MTISMAIVFDVKPYNLVESFLITIIVQLKMLQTVLNLTLDIKKL
jgi:hypothetical protein